MNRFLDSIRVGGWIVLSVAGAINTSAAGATNAAAPSAATAPARLSLADARRLAFERNWDLLASRSGIDSATAQLIVAKEFPNPTLSWSTAKLDVHGQGNGAPSSDEVWNRSYDTIVAVNQLVEIGGKRHARQSSARAGIVGARARFFDARRSLEDGVTKAYVAALLADETVRVLKESAGSLRHEADIAEVRLKAGDISDSDLKQIQNNADTFELQARSAQAASVQARISVEVLIGVSAPKGEWVPGESLDELTRASAISNPIKPGAERPDVLAAEADLRRSEFDLKLQKAVRIPDPTFLLEYERYPVPPPGPDTLGIGMSFPLPLWSRNRGNIQAAKSAVEQSTLALAKTRAQSAADLANARTAYEEAFERMQRYQNQIRPRAAKVRESVAFAYEKGGASLVDLLTAERDDNNVRLATAQAVADTAGTAADLAAAQTVMSEQELNSAK